MMLIARALLVEHAATLLRGEADCLRRMHTLAPHHVWQPDDSVAQAEHDRMLLVAHQLDAFAVELRRELAWAEQVTGQRLQPEGGN